MRFVSHRRAIRAGLVIGIVLSAAAAQVRTDEPAVAAPDTIEPAAPPQPTPPQTIDKRVFGVLPNYRTADGSLPFEPITARQKLNIARKDSFDWPLTLLGGAFAGLGQLTDQNSYLGQGMKGYANRYVRNYADQVIGNMFTEGLLPSILHEDPRYFRIGKGTFGHRFVYAASRVLVTKTDSGGRRFNFSEIGGNAIGSAISMSYFRDSRNVHDFTQKWGTQVATDAASQVMKEFWPDVKRRLFKHQADADGGLSAAVTTR